MKWDDEWQEMKDEMARDRHPVDHWTKRWTNELNPLIPWMVLGAVLAMVTGGYTLRRLWDPRNGDLGGTAGWAATIGMSLACALFGAVGVTMAYVTVWREARRGPGSPSQVAVRALNSVALAWIVVPLSFLGSALIFARLWVIVPLVLGHVVGTVVGYVLHLVAPDIVTERNAPARPPTGLED
jgi:hypothetical protein